MPRGPVRAPGTPVRVPGASYGRAARHHPTAPASTAREVAGVRSVRPVHRPRVQRRSPPERPPRLRRLFRRPTGLVRWRAGGTGPADRASGPWAEVQPLLPTVGRDRPRPGRPQPRRGDSRRGFPVRAAGRPAGMTPCVLRPGGPGSTRVGEIGPQGPRSRNGQASDPPAVTRRTGPERPTSSLRRSRRGRSRDLRPPHGETFAVWGDMSLLRRCIQERCVSSCG